MQFPLETRLAIDPQLRLKHDVDRAVLITRPQPLASRDYICRRVHPAEAVVLALLDGHRTLEEVGRLWAELKGKSPEDGISAVGKVVDVYTSGERDREKLLIEVGDGDTGRLLEYDPLEFVVPADRINLKDRRLRIPYKVYFLPTLFCPQKCIYCYARTRQQPEENLIGVERLREIFAELAGLGVEAIMFSGGDPFARKEIFEILEAVYEVGMVADIPTKLGLSYERACRLKALGVETVQLSLDSTDPAILDRMVGLPGYHRRAFRVLANLQRAELKVRVNTVLTPFNVGTAGGLIDYLGELGNVVRLSFSPYGRSLFCHQDELFVSEQDLDRVNRQIAERFARYPHMPISLGGAGPAPEIEDEEERRLNWERRAFCTANRDGFVILPEGQVTVCEELYDHPEFLIGDLKTQSVMEMWNSPAARALLYPDQAAVPDGPCRTCDDFETCNAVRGRCWRDVLKSYGWDKPHYPDPRCPVAPPGARLG